MRPPLCDAASKQLGSAFPLYFRFLTDELNIKASPKTQLSLHSSCFKGRGVFVNQSLSISDEIQQKQHFQLMLEPFWSFQLTDTVSHLIVFFFPVTLL